MMMMMKKKKYEEICMCLVLLLLLAISRARAQLINCTRSCGDVDIPFPFGIEPDCFLPGFHVVCNSSKLYYGDIQILRIDPNESEATLLQKIALVDPQNNSSTGVHISTEMDLTGLPFRFSSGGNIFVAYGCNVAAFFNTSSPFDYTRYGRSCAAICNDVINGSCTGADGCCQITSIPWAWGVQQFTSYLISGSPLQNSPCLFSTLVDRDSFNTASDLRGCALYERYQGQFPVTVDWFISNASCKEARINSTTYACRSRNSFCAVYFYQEYYCICNEGYQGNPYIEDGCSVSVCPLPGCYGICPDNTTWTCKCPPGTRGDPFRRNGCSAKDTRIRNILMIISASAGGSVLICSAIVALWKILKKRKSSKQKEEILPSKFRFVKKRTIFYG